MKDYRQANKGQDFEAFLRYANGRYRTRGEAIVTKIPTEFLPIRNSRGEITSCKVVEKSTVDFIGRVGDRPLAMEAKRTRSDSIRWDAVQDHQAAFLTDFCAKDEGLSLVLVSFDLRTFWAVPWDCWKAGRDAWREAQRQGKRKAETIYMLDYDWETNGKASLKESDLLDEWEVFIDGRVGLDYLRRYL